MYTTKAIAKKVQNGNFEVITIERGWTSEDDVDIEVKFCGFSPFADVHLANYNWGSVPGLYAVVGHEITGVVSKIGDNVKDVTVGDHVGVGYFIDSCLKCEYCHKGEENNCVSGITRTSCGIIKHGRVKNDNGRFSYGGRSKKITVNRRFLSTIPKSYPLEKAAPIMCAGVTMFTPLKKFGALNGGLKIGIMGFGGLGQMGAIMAKAMGNEVTVISTSNKKEELARQMGMDGYIVSKDLDFMKKSSNSLDIILDTIGADHEIENYLDMLKKNGTFVVLGIVSKPFEVDSKKLIGDQIKITGSDTGGMKVTQECIEFMAKKELFVETKLISSLDQLQKVDEELTKGTASSLYRYVIDIGKLL